MHMQNIIAALLALLTGGRGGSCLGGSGRAACRRHCGQLIALVGMWACSLARHVTQYTCGHPAAGKEAGSVIGKRQIAHSAE
eukprot:COSAG02_NODE_62703_length_265_cov_0.620482_1_plen_81_part_10